MKMSELKLKSKAELEALIVSLKTDIRASRFGRMFSAKKDTTLSGKSKKTIARILTHLRSIK